MKKAYIVAFLIIGVAMGFTLWAFSSSMTPYVTIQQAKASGTPVQVRGLILHDAPGVPQPYYDTQINALRFWIEDAKKERIEVVYNGGKPEAFDQAPGTAAHGMVRDGKFYSDKLIVQCPSKYNSEDKRKGLNKGGASGGNV